MMPSFVYMARDRNGVLQTGHLDAVGEEEVVGILQNRGLFVTSLNRKNAQVVRKVRAKRAARKRRLHGQVKIQDKMLLCTQIQTLLNAGIPLVRCLEIIREQVESRPMLRALERMRQNIEAGMTFRDAIAKHPLIFSSFWVNLVETGEASGHLPQVFQQLETYLTSAHELQTKAKTAMTYPLVLLGASAACVAVFMLKVIPVFEGIFRSSPGMNLPLLTQIIVNMSAFVRDYLFFAVAASVAAFWGMRELFRSDQGQWIFDRLLLKLPVCNKLFIGLQIAQFSRGMATLLASGVPILHSLDIMASSASNKVYGRAIGELKDFVREGKPMAEPLEDSGLFPTMLVQMVRIGEEVGDLGKMLERVAVHYEAEVTVFVNRLSTLFEPLAIAVMAVIVGTLVVAMYLPIFKMAGYQG